MSVLYTRTVTMKYIQKISIYVVALLLPIILVPQFAQAQTSSCSGYFDEIGCYTTGSYRSEFVQEFWDDVLHDEVIQATKSRNANRALFQLYERYKSDFVTDYAATSPAEDFAETFAWYVLDEETEWGSVAPQKIRFMDSLAQIRDYEEEILNNI
jgi:hypothetical protein